MSVGWRLNWIKLLVGCIQSNIMVVGDAHVVSGFLTPMLTQLSFQSHRLLPHMLQQSWEYKIRWKESSPQLGIKLITTRSWVQHAHHWATRVGELDQNYSLEVSFCMSKNHSTSWSSCSFGKMDFKNYTNGQLGWYLFFFVRCKHHSFFFHQIFLLLWQYL